MRSRKENVAKDNLPTSSSLPPYGSKNRVAGKSSRRQVILGCINPYEPPCKATTVRQQLKKEGEFCVVKIKKKDWMKWKRRPVSLNRIEGARGGDGMPGIFGKYLAIFHALCTAEAAVTALLSGSNFEPSREKLANLTVEAEFGSDNGIVNTLTGMADVEGVHHQITTFLQEVLVLKGDELQAMAEEEVAEWVRNV
ncbi:hypothetical protein DKX38_029172 [Salix brachista]|uniref:Uncharacterized protein n=1 Tax=Salix brachista TaxID=2182728 RepID=A0A5N5J2X1_9ROSI|nr:hypothetical protein DKX38_029172 [Salix brachista]